MRESVKCLSLKIKKEGKMRKIRLGRQEYKDKVLGFWLGKNIVGTPFEGQKYVYNLCE